LAILAIDLGPVGAVQIGKNESVVVLLDFDVKATYTLVVELN
jgi:hypothetical protein